MGAKELKEGEGERKGWEVGRGVGKGKPRMGEKKRGRKVK